MRCIVVFTLTACALLGAEGVPFQWSGSIASGKTLTIEGVNGDIQAEAAAGNLAEVSATISAQRSDPATAKVDVIESNGDVRICAMYPTRDGGYSGCGREGKATKNDIKVSFTVRVPRGVHLRANSVNGNVESSKLESDIKAETVNGRIRIATSGAAEAETVNGNIDAQIGAMARDLHFQTVNGSVTLTAPKTLNAVLNASTVNGSIRTDLPVVARGEISKRNLNASIGSGGGQLKIETVNGNISLQSANAPQ